MTTRIRSIFALVAVAGLALAGCSSDATDSTDAVVSEDATTEAPAIVDNSTVAALTGEPIEAGSLARPSLSAKIDNHPSARPQVGMDEADIVFEELVEGGLTRYLAVWHSGIACRNWTRSFGAPHGPRHREPLRWRLRLFRWPGSLYPGHAGSTRV